jgi:hypothetical protein
MDTYRTWRTAAVIKVPTPSLSMALNGSANDVVNTKYAIALFVRRATFVDNALLDIGLDHNLGLFPIIDISHIRS